MTTTARGARVWTRSALPLLLAAAVSVLPACTSVPEGPKPSLSGANTLLAMSPGGFYGGLLSDGDGRTLYQFTQDQPGGAVTCNAGCAQMWQPYIATGEPTPKDSDVNALQEQAFSTVTRSDGRQQVAYFGHPLYYFSGDRRPGDQFGVGQTQFGGRWLGVTAMGTPVVP